MPVAITAQLLQSAAERPQVVQRFCGVEAGAWLERPLDVGIESADVLAIPDALSILFAKEAHHIRSGTYGVTDARIRAGMTAQIKCPGFTSTPRIHNGEIVEPLEVLHVAGDHSHTIDECRGADERIPERCWIGDVQRRCASGDDLIDGDTRCSSAVATASSSQ
ncbi:MAG: hypothetical protein H0V93_00895 [Euzebyales bacterium]|nr:hypothetical protein [Euzebyales bacterium]